MILYHGSTSIINKPEFGKGKTYNDYGLGFYCTESLELAKEWSVNNDTNGYANIYSINTSELKILNLDADEFTSLHWITLLLQNRNFLLKSNIARRGKKYLIDNYSLPIEDYDIIIGYRADDSYFSFADSFLNNGISLEQLSESLYLGHLGKQVVLKSQKAFDMLNFVGYELAPHEKYFPLRNDRNDKAKADYLALTELEINSNDLYLNEIIRGDKLK